MPRCRDCNDTGVIETGNNDVPCDCPAGDTALFNCFGEGTLTGAFIKERNRLSRVRMREKETMLSGTACTPIALNEFGLAIWRHRNNNTLSVERPYDWCNRVIVLNGLRWIEDTEFSSFDFSDWVPVTVEEHEAAKRQSRPK